jgi:hypothetical protein
MTSCFIAAAIERYGVHGANELIAIATAHMNAKGE